MRTVTIVVEQELPGYGTVIAKHKIDPAHLDHFVDPNSWRYSILHQAWRIADQFVTAEVARIVTAGPTKELP